MTEHEKTDLGAIVGKSHDYNSEDKCSVREYKLDDGSKVTVATEQFHSYTETSKYITSPDGRAMAIGNDKVVREENGHLYIAPRDEGWVPSGSIDYS